MSSPSRNSPRGGPPLPPRPPIDTSSNPPPTLPSTPTASSPSLTPTQKVTFNISGSPPPLLPPRPNPSSQPRDQPSAAAGVAPPPPNPQYHLVPSSTLSTPNLLFSGLLALLAYFRISPWLIILVVALGIWSIKMAETEELVSAAEQERVAAAALEFAEAHPPPHFVNHAIENLWPIINDAIFTPVIDLLEDALQTELPGVVHSVRVDSLSQGATPLKVKFMRPMTDEEWFAGLEKGSSEELGKNRRGKAKVAGGGTEEKEEDLEGGDYACFEVCFELENKGKKIIDRAGLLIYFGVGVKGLGGVEMPVWVDLLKVAGIVRLRLLLDPSPPFVRTGTITFPTLPLIEIAAAPLKRNLANAMKIPGLKTYVLGSIKRVANAFVTPLAYTLDLDRLLTGAEGTVRTRNIGVLKITVQSAENLRAADTNGFSDPYVAISWWKQMKLPLWSTRPIERNLNPVWEETAFILVPADAIDTGEKLCLQVYDSDRWNADDSLGVVEIDLTALVEAQNASDFVPADDTRVDPLRSPKKSGKAQGFLTYSVQYFPLHHSAVSTGTAEGVAPSLAETKAARKENTLALPVFHVGDLFKPEDFKWEGERLERRKETVRWVTGQREREILECEEKPTMERRSGILAWNVLSLQNLQVRAIAGDFDHKSAGFGGKPALADVTNNVEGFEEEPVSSYVEVVLNDRLVFRSRTKKLNASPYVNAASERFIRDWSMEKVTFVVREERERERDPILGIVEFKTLGEAFNDRSEVVKWYPLIGGIGYGIMRLSLLWKPINLDLPRGVSGFDIVQTEIHSLKLINVSPLVASNLPSTIVGLETEADSRIISPESGEAASTSSLASPSDSPSSYSWNFESKIALATLYRLSGTLVVRFFQRNGSIKKKNVTWGIGLLQQAQLPDGELFTVGVPIYGTSNVSQALAWAFGQGEKARENAQANEVGTAVLSVFLRPGIGKAHLPLLKKDKRLANVEEVRRISAKAGLTQRHKRSSSSASKISLDGPPSNDPRPSTDSSGSFLRPTDDEDRSSFSDLSFGGSTEARSERTGELSGEDSSDPEEEGGWYRRMKNRSRDQKTEEEGLHKHKSVRTANYVKDKIAGKISRMGSSGKHSRREGAQRGVEKEGISSLN